MHRDSTINIATLLTTSVLLAVACRPSSPDEPSGLQATPPATSPGDAPTPDGLTPVPMPAWVGFPADPGPLQQAIDARDSSTLRAHAWRLWAGLNQPISADDPTPLWWTWSTTTQLFEQPQPAQSTPAQMTQHRHAARTLPRAVVPAAAKDRTDECFDAQGNGVIFFPSPTYVLPEDIVTKAGLDPQCADPKHAAQPNSGCGLPDGTHFQNNGDILVATESYSKPGADRIVSLGYDQTSTLQTLLDDGTTMLPNLAAAQLTTKHMYWPIKAEGLSALPVYRDLPKSQWCQYNGYETWASLVAVDPSGQAKGQGKVEFLFGVYDHDGTAPLPTTTATVDIHPIDELYARRFDQAAFEALDETDRLILDAASRWAHGKPFEPGDYVVAVASHIITKEIPQWTLQSAWWSDQPDAGPYAADRPSLPDAVGPWAHYLMTTEYGITTDPGGAVLPVAFNPYIELAATHPVATNCRNCHLRAGWPKGQYLTPQGPGPLADLTPQDPIFAGLLLTDFQWVIADRVAKPGS